MAEDTPVDGNLDFKGGCIKNGGFETFSTLPTTFQGTQITFSGKVYTWNVAESKYKCDTDYLEIGGRNLVKDSGVEITGTGRLRGYTLSEPLIYGETYTATFKAKKSEGANFRLWLNNGSTNSGLSLDGNDPNEIIIKNHTFIFRGSETNANLVAIYSEFSSNPSTIYWLQIEKGNKATDWTPAPEDQVTDWNETDVNSFSFLKNKPTQLSQFIDNIGVASHIEDEANPHSVTKAQVGLGDVDNTSDLLKPVSTATQTAIDTAINELEIGGRNYILNSKDFQIGYSAPGISVSLTSEGYLQVVAEAGNINYAAQFLKAGYNALLYTGALKEGDLITVSMEVKSPNSTALPTLLLKTGYPYIQFKGTLSDKFSKVSFTTTWMEAEYENFHLGFAGLVGTYIFKNIKLEKGNIATDWTPAPEDVQAEIDGKVDKVGDTMSGDLDMGGNQIKNVAIEVVTSLPTTDNFDGRQVTYEGRSYIWNGTAWKNDSDYIEIGGRNLIPQSNFVGLGNSSGWNVDNNPLYNGGVALKLDDGRKAQRPIKTLNNCPIGAYTLSARYYISPEYNTSFRIATAFTQPNNIHNNLWGIKVGEWHTESMVFENTIEGSDISVSLYNSDVFTQGYIIVDWIKLEKGNIATDWTPAPEDKADENQTINFNINTEPTQTGTVTKTSTWLWQYLTQSTNFLWLKLKDLFPLTQATTHNYLPKIDNLNKKLVKSNIYDDGSNVGIGTANPVQKLDVNGILKLGLGTNVLLGLSANVANRASLTLNSTTGNPADLIFKNGSITTGNYGQWAISARNGSNDYRFSIWRGSENDGELSESEVFSIAPSGKVGIGTTTPSEALDVNGSVKANGYKVGDGINTKLLTDGGGTKPITEFATSTHDHDTLYAKLGFYSVKVGSTYITAASNQDTIEFVAGTNVLLNPDAVGKTVTIASSYRVIKANNSQYISSGALNFFGTGGVQITPSFGVGVPQDLKLEFSADPNVLISLLGDLPNSADLWDSGIGVSFLKYGNTYNYTPNPVCGTDTSSTTIEGFLTHYNSGDQHSFTFHDVRTNKMYISSNFWDEDEQTQIWNDWKRLITCTDLSEAEEVLASFDSNKWVIELFGESSSATILAYEEKDEINIDITAYETYVLNRYNQGHLGVFTFTHNLKFISATPYPPQIQFVANGIVIATAPAYLDPNTITTSVTLIEFTFKMFYSSSQSAVVTNVRNTIY